MPSTKLEITHEGRKTIFDVAAWPTASLPLHIYSSSSGLTADFAAGSWKDNDLRAIQKRMRDREGGEKGRVLYVVGWYGLPFRLEIVAAGLLHFPKRPNRPLMMSRVCFSDRLNVDDRSTATALLLRCGSRLAVKSRRAGGRLEWQVPRADAGTLAKQFELRSVRRTRGNGQILEWTPFTA